MLCARLSVRAQRSPSLGDVDSVDFEVPGLAHFTYGWARSRRQG
jgi:hypothetical protein